MVPTLVSASELKNPMPALYQWLRFDIDNDPDPEIFGIERKTMALVY